MVTCRWVASSRYWDKITGPKVKAWWFNQRRKGTAMLLDSRANASSRRRTSANNSTGAGARRLGETISPSRTALIDPLPPALKLTSLLIKDS
jgi:hypothetical protein